MKHLQLLAIFGVVSAVASTIGLVVYGVAILVIG